MIDLIKHLMKEQEEVVRTSNFDKVIDKFKSSFPEEHKNEVDKISDYVKSYIRDNNYTIKFLNSCSTGFSGVRLDKAIVICSPNFMSGIGDFLYTIFHEIRHEQQIGNIKMSNPLTDYDLEDFEKIAKQYWDLEMDADRFGKEMIAKLIIKLGLPIDTAKENLGLSGYIENYPLTSKMVLSQLKMIIDSIKQIKKSGGEYTDIQDHPMIKRHLDKLENFI